MITELLAPTSIQTNGYHDIAVPDEHDPFPYGWRNVERKNSDGTSEWHQIPLTPEDFFNPQLGDYMPQDQRHAKLAIDIHDKLEKFLPTMTVLFDTKILWGIPGHPEPFPDVTVIPAHVDTEAATFDCVKHGVRPCLIVEIMSPQYLGDDTKKVTIYEQAGVTEYFIINPHFKQKRKPMEIMAYRLHGQSYQPIAKDDYGRWWSETTGVWFTLDVTQRHLVLLAGTTGQPLLTNKEEQAARLSAEAHAESVEARLAVESQARTQAELEIAQLRAELARLRGEA